MPKFRSQRQLSIKRRDEALRALKTISMPSEWGFISHAEPGRGSAHIWIGNDSACRMWSTGGLPFAESFRWTPSPDRKVCKRCEDEIGSLDEMEQWPFPEDPRYL